MRLINRRAAGRRAIAGLLALACCLVPVIAGVHAQEPPATGSAAIASAGEPVLLREQPGFDAAVLATLGDGNPLDVAGATVTAVDGTSWLPVVAAGQSGYVPAGYVVAAPAEMAPPAAPETLQEPMSEPVPEPVAASSMTSEAAPGPVPGSTGTTTTETNLRAGPSVDTAIVTVFPPGTLLSIDGPAQNGFIPVTGNGSSGWIAADLLAGGAAATAPGAVTPPGDEALTAPGPVAVPPSAEPAPEVASAASTGIAWPIAGGEWEVVQGYNNGTHTNRSSFAQYKYSLDWARVDGNTAGQPVYAPVSGTVEWVDRGSGGMLVDAGNGYGVAVFHVTLDRGLSSGDTVTRGQEIGAISGPGGEGYMSMAHIDITVWRLTGSGHESVPFVGPNAIAGREFPDSGGVNQHMGATVTP